MVTDILLDTLQTTNQLGPNNLVFQAYFANSMFKLYNSTKYKLTEILGRKIPCIPCQAYRKKFIY